MSDQIGIGRRTYSYRLYSADDAHLYSGTTTDIRRRMREHRASHRWFNTEVAFVEVEEYDTRWRAILAERRSGLGTYGQFPANIGRRMRKKLRQSDLADIAAMISEVQIAERTGVTRMTVRNALGK